MLIARCKQNKSKVAQAVQPGAFLASLKMADESVVDEMADIGSGVSDQVGCSSVVFAFFAFGSLLTYSVYKLLA